jgi:phage terminase small subunit
MITNPKHKVFAEEYILTSNPIASYQKAYPKATSESARVKSYSLLQNVTLANYIKAKQLEIQNARQNNLIDTLKNKDSTNILKREKVLEMVSNVVKISYNKAIKDEKFIDAFNKSVAVLNKMEGYDATNKIDLTTKGESLNNPIFGENPLLNNLKNNAK